MHGLARNILFKNQFVEVQLLYWTRAGKGPIHDHPGNMCAMKILKGRLVEKRYTKPNRNKKPQFVSAKSLSPGSVSYIKNNSVLHSIQVMEPSTTLNIYMPPIENFKEYSVEDPVQTPPSPKF